MKQTSLKNGFTLSELTMVIVIIAALAGTALPRISAAINRGRNMEAENMLMAIFTAQQDYFRENDPDYANDVNNLDVVVPNMKHFTLVGVYNSSTAGACFGNALAEVGATDSTEDYELWVDVGGSINCKDGGDCTPIICRKMGYQ